MAMGVRYFSDIDLWTLTGVNEILSSDITYPYVQIDSVTEREKTITFFYDSENSYRVTYKRNGDHWMSEKIIHEEGSDFYFYEFIEDKRIIEMEYEGDPSRNGYLLTLRIHENNRIVEYDFEPKVVKQQPHVDIRNIPIEKAIRKEDAQYEIKNGIFTYRSQRINTNSQQVIQEEKCYWVDGLSFFWWSIYGYKFGPIDCP